MLFDLVGSLSVLDLSSNLITALPPSLPGSLASVIQLNMASNKISTIPNLAHLTSLMLLNVSDNLLVSLPPLPSTVTFLNASNNPSLVVPARFLIDYPLSVADVSGATIPSSRISCAWRDTSHRMSALQMRGIRFVERGLADTITSCLPRVDLLDLSGSGLSNLTFLNDTISKIPFILPVSPDDDLGNIQGHLQLGAENPVRCDLAVYAKKRFLHRLFQPLPSAIYACSCSPAFERGSDGTCSRIPEFWTGAKVAGLAVGSMILTLLATSAVLFALRRHRTVRANLELHRMLLEDTQEEVVALKRAWEVLPSEIRLERRVDGDSPGAFGEVWSGKWEELTVAVKMLQQGVMDMDPEALDEFHKEVEFMQKTRHPNIVRFFGAGTWTDGRPFFVVELVTKGSLKSLLRGQHHEHKRDLPWKLRISFALDVARGMAYIHGLGQMHRDLKPGNVLITEQDRAKIADFGTIRQLLTNKGRTQRVAHGAVESRAQQDPRSLELTAGKGTPLYMSPEVIRGGDYNQQADIWSFGVLLWEIGSQRSPDLLEQEGGASRGPMLGRLLAMLEEGKRLRMEESWPAWYRVQISQCWAGKAEDRPPFAALVDQMEKEER
jgi:LRR receptor-like serine/threonine-protein kinase FLS2